VETANDLRLSSDSRAGVSAVRPVAIVTGGAGEGIGGGITEALAAKRWAILIVDQDEVRARSLRTALAHDGCEIDVLTADITQAETPGIAVERVMRVYGRLDGLVNSAGIGLCKPLAEVTDAEFEALLDVDFRAAFRFCRAALRVMGKGGGAIVNIGSVHARRTIRGYAVYAAMKCAMEGLTRGLAVDYGPQNVRANCIHPGLVMSPQNHDLISRFTPDVDAWLSSFVSTKQLVPALVTRRQVGELAAFLLGPEGTSITGQSITIDGGSSAMLYEREASA
jgi:NAD(P)-dependent dehydrogenase (short-subunit alcohol dehydrogenase family)